MPGPIERVFLAQPSPIGGGSVIASPFQFFMEANDSIRLTGWTSRAGVTLKVVGRQLRLDGSVEPFRKDLPLAATRLESALAFTLGAGFLLNLSVLAVGATLVTGECFTRVDLYRGLAGATEYMGTIAQGYVTNTQARSFPGSPLELSTDGPGVVRQFTGTNPPAGFDMDETVPTGARWELVSFFSLLVADATVATRRPVLRLETAVGGILCESRHFGGQTASQSGGYSWSQGIPLETVPPGQSGGGAGLPTNQMLLAGNHILTVTSGLALGDDWQSPDVTVSEWLEANA